MTHRGLAGMACRLTLATVPLLCLAAGPDTIEHRWHGNWQLDRARSRLIGPAIRIGRTKSGYSFDFGAVRFDIPEDGKDHITVAGRSTSLKRTGQRFWFRVHKVNGREIDRSTIMVTADQKMMLIRTRSIAPDGRTASSQEMLRRLGDGEGLAGAWRSLPPGIDVPQRIVIRDGGSGRIRIDYPAEGQFYLIRPGGDLAPLRGARSVPGVTLSVRRISPARLRWTEYVAGKSFRRATDHLSSDGLTLQEISWPTAHPGEKHAVYKRSASDR